MNHYPHPIIAREGWPFLGIAVAAALIATQLLGGWSWPLWIIAVFVLQFFRDPPRTIPQDANAVLSPADGRIVVVEKAHDPYANRESLKISPQDRVTSNWCATIKCVTASRLACGLTTFGQQYPSRLRYRAATRLTNA